MATTVPGIEANNFDPPIEPGNGITSGWYEGSIASSTQSLTESILDHVYENGRRYHLKSKDQHLDILRGNLTMTKFKEDPANVLDYGCGTGIWNLEFGDEHLGSHSINLDLAPIQL
ncbi:hypothetical protein EX30DRAFT_124833 [Ascodesmis nigricans]|uniref:Methyltransferase domain-containing protein n=1 Tax=Ascodesmis nigricans TaxID=341454 RepID=A0A4S2MP54_9PEZI|nr:hypothetical protein EX30DRAFT_124833 [Ascodesmis nigricans]